MIALVDVEGMALQRKRQMGVDTLDIQLAIEKLREKRPIFHSEADFQFALAWQIQTMYQNAAIRLEYPSIEEPNKYIDIIVKALLPKSLKRYNGSGDGNGRNG